MWSKKSLKSVVICGGGGCGRVESSFGLYFELLASICPPHPPRVMLGSAESCSLVTEQIIVLGLGKAGGHLILAWPMSLPLPSGSCYRAMGLPCLRKVASACSSVWLEKPEPSQQCVLKGRLQCPSIAGPSGAGRAEAEFSETG